MGLGMAYQYAAELDIATFVGLDVDKRSGADMYGWQFNRSTETNMAAKKAAKKKITRKDIRHLISNY